MIPNNFEYHRAQSVDDAIALMARYGMDAKLLAGGHSLLPAMKLRLNQPDVLIDIRRLPELRFIRKGDKELIIGAGSTHHDLATSELARNTLSMICEAAELIGDKQVRNMGTIGGSLAHADPAADWPAVLIAADAKIHLKGPKGERQVAAEDFFTGFFTTALGNNEVITSIHIPMPLRGTRSSYQKFMQPASRFAIVGCAAVVSLSNGIYKQLRVAFTGVSENAFRAEPIENALKGKELSEENIGRAVANATGSRMVLSDHFASEEYRKHLAGVYAKRALMAASR